MTAAPIRIVSDLHVGELRSRVQAVSALEPLLEGVAHLVLNGDTLETRFLDLDPVAAAFRRDFAAFSDAHAGRLTVITGNHDPDLSPHHHLELAGGRVLVTHGDVLFPEMAPWGWEAPHFRAEWERRTAALSTTERGTIEARLRVCKETIVAIRDLSPHRPGRYAHPWARHFRALLSFPRIHRMWKAWRDTPSNAARLAEECRPAARTVVIGHVHRPGIWSCRGRTVINTGSAIPPLGALAVDLDGDRLLLRGLHFTSAGVHAGPVRSAIELQPV